MPFPFKSPFHVFTLCNLTNKTVNFISQVPVLQKLDSATIQWIRIGTNQLWYLLQSWPKGFETPPPFHVFLKGIAANGLKKIFPHPHPPPPDKVKVLKVYKICKKCLTCNTQHCSGGGGEEVQLQLHFPHLKHNVSQTFWHRRTGRGGGFPPPPNFGQLRFFGQKEKFWAKPTFKDVSCFFFSIFER